MTTRTLLYIVLTLPSLLLANVNATPCKTFDEWINAGSATTSVKCVTPRQIQTNGQRPFTIPDAFAATLTNLNELVLNDLGIEGSISSLTSLTMLTNLALRGNLWTGPMPNLAALSLLTALDLGYNPTFDAGPIPDAFSTMSALGILYLSTTGRTSTLPTSLETLVALSRLDLGMNQLVGTISPAIAALPALEIFYLKSNQLTGPVPTALVNPNLYNLHLSSNRFSGSLNTHPFDEAHYTSLSLAGNRMFGVMPAFSIRKGQTVDVIEGESLGDFIPDGDSCSSRTSDCSSGASSCGTNGICCAAIWIGPNQRGTCPSELCQTTTGACVTTSPSTAPISMATTTPSTTPTRHPATSPTTSPSKSPSKAPSASVSGSDGNSLLIPLLSVSGMAAVAGFFLIRRQSKRDKLPGMSKHISGDIGTNWLPNPKYVVMGGMPDSSQRSSMGSTSFTTAGSFDSRLDSSHWTSTYSKRLPKSFGERCNDSVSVASSFRGHVNDVTSVADMDV